MVRKLLSGVVALAVLLGSVAVVNAGDLASGNKPGAHQFQGGKKKHKKGGKKGGKKKAGKGKKHGKIEA
jgi:Spy/CpxP family protein refolding chaperone